MRGVEDAFRLLKTDENTTSIQLHYNDYIFSLRRSSVGKADDQVT